MKTFFFILFAFTLSAQGAWDGTASKFTIHIDGVDDYITRLQKLPMMFTENTGTLQYQFTGPVVTFYYSDEENFYMFDFQADRLDPLRTEVYYATRYPFTLNDPETNLPLDPKYVKAGMSFGGNGMGCNTLQGTFEVLNIKTSYSAAEGLQLRQADIKFLQGCEGFGGGASFGRIIFEK